jgi:hypothetical protein
MSNYKQARPLSTPTNDKERILKLMCRFDNSISDVCKLLDITESTFISWMTGDVPDEAANELENVIYYK